MENKSQYSNNIVIFDTQKDLILQFSLLVPDLVTDNNFEEVNKHLKNKEVDSIAVGSHVLRVEENSSVYISYDEGFKLLKALINQLKDKYDNEIKELIEKV